MWRKCRFCRYLRFETDRTDNLRNAYLKEWSTDFQGKKILQKDFYGLFIRLLDLSAESPWDMLITYSSYLAFYGFMTGSWRVNTKRVLNDNYIHHSKFVLIFPITIPWNDWQSNDRLEFNILNNTSVTLQIFNSHEFTFFISRIHILG